MQQYSDIFQAFTFSRGNELRLGKSDAPPPFFSIHLGKELENVLAGLDKFIGVPSAQYKKELNAQMIELTAGVHDYADNSRTSPCAFTGDKLEFRALGSSATVAQPMAVLNAIIAKSFEQAATELKGLLDNKLNRDDAVLKIITSLNKESKPTLYSGNTYSEE